MASSRTAVAVTALCHLVCPSLSSRGGGSLLPVANRLPPQSRGAAKNDGCGAICVGPGVSYPVGRKPGVVFKSRFVVPDLPREHDPIATTYYDYLNIYWRSQPDNTGGGYYNQFVPQLMLGNALANSTNFPDYTPQWIELDSWHIGAQYFMGLCAENDTYPDGFDCDPAVVDPRAATGRLLPVEPGEVVETSLLRSTKGKRPAWILRIGVVGAADRTSVVVADRPFMGLVGSATTTSWDEDIYDDVYVGSCLENYGMASAANYPPDWWIDVDVWSPEAGTWWSDWRVYEERTCPWQPKSSVESVARDYWQRAVWEATLEDGSVPRTSTLASGA